MKSRQVEFECTCSKFRNEWVRNQKELWDVDDFRAYDIDLGIWRTDSDFFMLLELKSFNSKMKIQQAQFARKIDMGLRHSPINDDYFNFHTLTFSRETPADGITVLDHYKPLTRNQVIDFLLFNGPNEWYIGFFERYKNDEWKNFCQKASKMRMVG